MVFQGLGPIARRKYGINNTVLALWKQGWNEIPEVMGAMCFGAIGIGMAVIGQYRIETMDKNNHRYKGVFTIMRPDDPRMKRRKVYEGSPEPTTTPRCLLD